jgi:hypothetical protein
MAATDKTLELFGRDIALDGDWQPVILADGALQLCAGVDTANQDIALRLYTVLETLFYDVNFGSLVMMYVQDENTQTNRAGLCAEVAMRLNRDPGVVPGTASCRVQSWSPEDGVILAASYRLITENHPRNLVVSVDGKTMEMTVKELVADADPRQ